MGKSSKSPETHQSKDARLLRDSLIDPWSLRELLFPPSPPTKPTGVPKSTYPSGDSGRSIWAPGRLDRGVEPGQGRGQGFPSNLTWADSRLLLPGTVPGGSPELAGGAGPQPAASRKEERQPLTPHWDIPHPRPSSQPGDVAGPDRGVFWGK